jgi:hypothetical protein
VAAEDEVKIEPGRIATAITLSAKTAGLKRVLLWDGTAGTNLDWPADVPLTLESSPLSTPTLQPRWTLYFYVPKNTKWVGGFGGGSGTMNDSDGKAVYTFGKDDFFNVAVTPGQDGKLWSFRDTSGSRQLLTVPPYLARSGGELLLPREVVERDAG